MYIPCYFLSGLLSNVFSGGSNSFDLKREIMKLVFDDDDKMLPISAEANRFISVMANFSKYERKVYSNEF